ncbi:MAG: diacylglycerol kinase [Demequinaceae bacterium]|nr:diacylglycerol kinase [Demequinaceae bacterium]
MMWQIVSIVALVAGIAALWLAVGTIRRLGARDPGVLSAFARRLFGVHDLPHDSVVAFDRAQAGHDRVAFIVNPTKPGLARLREAAYRACSARHLPEPMWMYTTMDDPGTEAARKAIIAGAEVLIAAGGDGTVRAVAAAASDSGLPMGIVPLGTGNLLARNLDLPLKDTGFALEIALDGDDTLLDIGWLMITRESGETYEFPFLVMAGIGLDAEMVAGVKASLKSRIGWLAYLLAALRHVGATRMRATVQIDDQDPIEKKMRTVLIANCGRLPGGLVLVPDARIDDGALDIAILDARGGIAGWTELASQVWLQGTRISTPTLPDAWRVGRIDHARGTSVEIRAEAPQRIQVDGDLLGRASDLRAWVEPGAVKVRSIARPTKKRQKKTPVNAPVRIERRRSG